MLLLHCRVATTDAATASWALASAGYEVDEVVEGPTAVVTAALPVAGGASTLGAWADAVERAEHLLGAHGVPSEVGLSSVVRRSA